MLEKDIVVDNTRRRWDPRQCPSLPTNVTFSLPLTHKVREIQNLHSFIIRVITVVKLHEITSPEKKKETRRESRWQMSNNMRHAKRTGSCPTICDRNRNTANSSWGSIMIGVGSEAADEEFLNGLHSQHALFRLPPHVSDA